MFHKPRTGTTNFHFIKKSCFKVYHVFYFSMSNNVPGEECFYADESQTDINLALKYALKQYIACIVHQELRLSNKILI